MDLAFWTFGLIRAIAIVLMAYSFHYGIKEKSFFKGLVFWLFGLMILDVIVQLEELRP